VSAELEVAHLTTLGAVRLDLVALKPQSVLIDDETLLVEVEAAVAREERTGLAAVVAGDREESASADRHVEHAAGLLQRSLRMAQLRRFHTDARAKSAVRDRAAEDIGEPGARRLVPDRRYVGDVVADGADRTPVGIDAARPHEQVGEH